MRLGSGTYKEIALDALKGNWVKAAVAGLFANWLGVFSSSFLFIAKYAFIATFLLEGLYALDILILTWRYWIEERTGLPA